MAAFESQACWLTSAARSAVAVIGLRGPEATAALDALFVPRSSGHMDAVDVGELRFGQWVNGEDVVVCRAVDQWEIHCHGGVAAAPHILADLSRHQIHIVDLDQWEVKAGGSEVANIAWQQLAQAKTARTATILLDQALGAWDRHAATIEQWLDENDQREQVAAAIQQLHEWSDLGRHLIRPWRVALFGAPNAGKSTLINRIVGFQRSVVFQQPGTTRDLVTSTTVVDGWPLEFCDTAGLRRSDDLLEMAGTELTADAVGKADLAVEVVDLTGPVTAKDLGVSIDGVHRLLRVGNKRDQLSDNLTAVDFDVDLMISAQTGEGVEHLLDQIVAICIPSPPPAGAAIPFAPICFDKLVQWQSRLGG